MNPVLGVSLFVVMFGGLPVFLFVVMRKVNKGFSEKSWSSMEVRSASPPPLAKLRETDPDFSLVLFEDFAYALFARGETDGIFQFESDGMKEYLRRLKPTSIVELTAMNALYRPGPLGARIGDYNMVDLFIRRKQGEEAVTYTVPTMEPILKDTYGITVYQEQIIRIATDIAGYSGAEADLMRRLLAPVPFAAWLGGFLPGIPLDGSPSWLEPAIVTDPGDGKLAHLDGLNLSRAWMLEGIASGLPARDRRRDPAPPPAARLRLC